jgi:hypothetical protein
LAKIFLGVEMPLINEDTLKSFFGENSFIQKNYNSPGIQQAIRQAENLVYQNTLIPIPEDIQSAIPALQFYAHSIFSWIITGTQGNLPQEEIQRRKDLYNNAVSELEAIRLGKKDLYDSSGTKIETGFSSPGTFYVNAERSERL